MKQVASRELEPGMVSRKTKQNHFQFQGKYKKSVTFSMLHVQKNWKKLLVVDVICHSTTLQQTHKTL